jgi:hypothetical protein
MYLELDQVISTTVVYNHGLFLVAERFMVVLTSSGPRASLILRALVSKKRQGVDTKREWEAIY